MEHVLREIPQIPRGLQNQGVWLEPSHLDRERVPFFVEACAEVVSRHGFAAFEALTGVLHRAVAEGRSPKREELAQVFAEHPDYREFSRRLLDRMAGKGQIRLEGESEVILGKDFLTLSNKEELVGKNTSLADHPLARHRVEMFLIAFAEKRVRVLRDGRENLEPVFYAPSTVQEAFSPETIRLASFHFAPFSLFQWTKDLPRNATIPTAQERVPLLSAMVACALYHPRFGGAERDGAGRLIVSYKNGERKSLTGDWFKETPGMQLRASDASGEKYEDIASSPLAFIRQHLPELFAHQLLLPSDFQEKNAREVKERVKDFVAVSSTGFCVFEGLRYSLGRRFAGKEVIFQKITQGDAVIFVRQADGTEKPEGFVRLFVRSDAGVKKNPNGSSFTFDVPASSVRLRPFDETGQPFFSEVSSDEQFFAKESFIRAMHMHDFEEKLRRDGLSLRSLPRSAYEHIVFSPLIDQHRHVVELGLRESAGRGMEILSPLVDDELALPEVFRSLSLLPEDRKEAFAGSIVEAVRLYIAYRDEARRAADQGRLSSEQVRTLLFEARTRLFSTLGLLRDLRSDDTLDTSTLLARFAEHNTSYEYFGTLFREACKGRDDLDVASLEGVEIERHEALEISFADRADMVAMFDANWKDQQAAARHVARESFVKALEGRVPAEWNVLKKDGKIVGFLRADLVERGFYLGSLNVAPEQKSSAIGEQLLQVVVREYGSTQKLFAHFVPSLLAGTSYVERQGFVITGTSSLDARTRVIAIERHADVARDGLRYEERARKTFLLPQDQEGMLNFIDAQVALGLVGTRFFIPDQNPQERTVVFSSVQS